MDGLGEGEGSTCEGSNTRRNPVQSRMTDLDPTLDYMMNVVGAITSLLQLLAIEIRCFVRKQSHNAYLWWRHFNLGSSRKWPT